MVQNNDVADEDDWEDRLLSKPPKEDSLDTSEDSIPVASLHYDHQKYKLYHCYITCQEDKLLTNT